MGGHFKGEGGHRSSVRGDAPGLPRSPAAGVDPSRVRGATRRQRLRDTYGLVGFQGMVDIMVWDQIRHSTGRSARFLPRSTISGPTPENAPYRGLRPDTPRLSSPLEQGANRPATRSHFSPF